MLSQRITGGFVCLRCQLSLASRSWIRPSPLRPYNTAVSIHDAPRRSYSDSPERPTWKGRLPIDEPQDDKDPWRGLEEQARDGRSPASKRGLPVDQAHDAAQTQDPWQGAFEQRTGAYQEKDWMRQTRQNNAEDAPDTQEQAERPKEGSVYRHIRVSGKRPARSRSRATPTLSTGPDFYTAKGQRLKPTNQSLPIDILGKPGHALVLRDAGPRRRKKPEQIAPETPSDSTSPINFATIYESIETDVPSSAEVLQNIHELQPTENILPRREFEALKKTLSKGFTKAQLAAYIQKSSVAAEDKDEMAGLGPWAWEKWPWTPEVESDSGTTDPLLQGYVSRSTAPKDRLAIALMRQCWGLGMQELQSQQGYLDVRVRDLQFDLLMLGNRGWLESIPKSLFEPGTQIELIRSEKIVRIIAPKVAAELILQEFNAVLEQAHTSLLDATQISPRQLDQSILDEVGKITHTVVRYDQSGKNIEVSWITAPENQREGLEDLADVAFRLLFSACGYKQPGDATMEVQPEQHQTGGWYLPDYHNQGKMAWRDRIANWARWTMATPRRGARQTEPVQILSNERLCRSLDAIPSRSFVADGWSSEPQITTKAVFGHVLHREPAEPKDQLFTSDKIIRVQDNLDRTLAPVIPPLASLAALTSSSSESTTTQTSIVLRFLPAANPSLPPLELTLLTDPDSDVITPQSIRALSRVSTHDILLPSHAVDVRLTETTSYILPGSSLASFCPSLAAFLASADLRPRDGVLATPPRPPPIHLPSRVLSGSSSSETTGGEEEVSYLFAGLELRRKVSTSVSGWKLSYTSVEAGQGGGRRAELALEGVRTGDADVDEMPLTEFERFERGFEKKDEKATVGERGGAREYLETLERLALGREFAWFGEVPERDGGEGVGVSVSGRSGEA